MEVDQEFMYLDEEAIRSLDLIESKRAMYRTGKSLFSVLNRCKTNVGKELLANWLENPLADINKINSRLDIVQILSSSDMLRDSIGECLSKLPDLKRLTCKLSSKKCTLIDCCKIYHSFFSIGSLIEIIESEKNKLLDDEFLHSFKNMQKQCSSFSALIDETVDKESLENGDPLIDAKYDTQLIDLGESMSTQKRLADKAFKKIANELGLEEGKTIKLEVDPQNGFVARITRRLEDQIRGKEKYRTFGTKKDGVRFATKELQKISEDYQEARKEYEEIQSTIFDNILDTLRTYCKPIEQLNDIIAKLDVYYSIADAGRYSSEPYVRPTLLPKGTGRIKLDQLRHPCLENQSNIYFIPNSIEFDKDKKKFFIITGPNMGGKSTFLRSIGIAVLLAQIGSFVPANKAEISICDGIFTRIGASDKQFKGISTFKAEMLETSEILKRATEDSLVIIDELGRGTSTFDGCGLAYSISKEIAENMKSYCLFATHFHELTTLAKEIPSVENLFVNYEFNEKNNELKMLYQVQKGVCDQKFGIHVAKMVQFPSSMVEYAEEKVKKYESIENPANKEELEKLSNLITERAKENLNEMNDEELISFLSKIAMEVK